MISVKVEIPDLAELLKNEERDVMRLITFGTAERMVAKLNEPGTGRSYKRGKKFHIASAPGKPPTNDSSNLTVSITPNLIDGFNGEINLAEYGFFLEFGTDKIAPRPFIVPSLEEILADL